MLIFLQKYSTLTKKSKNFSSNHNTRAVKSVPKILSQEKVANA